MTQGLHLFRHQDEVPVRGVVDEHRIGGSFPDPGQQGAEVLRPDGEGLKGVDDHPLGGERRPLVLGQLDRPRGGRVEDPHPLGAPGHDEPRGRGDKSSQAGDPEEVAVPRGGELLLERGRRHVRNVPGVGQGRHRGHQAVHEAPHERRHTLPGQEVLGGRDCDVRTALVVPEHKPDRPAADPAMAVGLLHGQNDPVVEPLSGERPGDRVDFSDGDGRALLGPRRAASQEGAADHEGYEARENDRQTPPHPVLLRRPGTRPLYSRRRSACIAGAGALVQFCSCPIFVNALSILPDPPPGHPGPYIAKRPQGAASPLETSSAGATGPMVLLVRRGHARSRSAVPPRQWPPPPVGNSGPRSKLTSLEMSVRSAAKVLRNSGQPPTNEWWPPSRRPWGGQEVAVRSTGPCAAPS